MRLPVWTLLAAFFLAPPMAVACPGDCDGDGIVTVDELTVGTRVVLGHDEVFACFSLDVSGDFLADVSEITLAVSAALNGCSPTAEDLALLGVYDATATYLYSSGPYRREGVAVIETNSQGQVGLLIDFDPSTTLSLNLRSTPPQMVRLDGFSLEESDLTQPMSGSVWASVQSTQTSLEGTVVSSRGRPFFPSLSHAVDLELTRVARDYATRLAGSWQFSFDGTTKLEAVMPIHPAASGVGTCGPADMVESSGTIVRHLDEAPCYFSPAGHFLYRGPQVTLRGELVDSYQFAFGQGTWEVGVGRFGDWSATRAQPRSSLAE